MAQRYRKQKTCYGLISASRDGHGWRLSGWAGILPIRGSQNAGVRNLFVNLFGLFVKETMSV